jgi:carbon monoxide dehydrogenase subunit G
MIKAVINIEAPRNHVFQILTDYPNYRSWLPGCEESNVLTSSGSSTDTEVTINSMKKMKIGLRFDAVPTQTLNFKMISGKDLKAYEGAYRLMDSADGKGTVVIAEMEIDAGAMVPRFMVDRVAKKSIDETGTALKKYAAKVPVTAAATLAARAPSAKPAEALRHRRARKIIQVTKTSAGYSVWLQGETFAVKSAK